MIPGTPAVSATTKDISPRLVEQTETSDIYANGDGTRTAVFYAGPVNFFDKTANQWRKLDKQFQRKNDRIENGAGPVRVQLPSHLSASDAITVGKDDWSVSFAFSDAKSKRPAELNKGGVRFNEVAPGISLEYRMLSNGLKEDIVLDQPPPADWPGYYRFRLSATGVTPVAVDGGTAVSLQDGERREVGRIPRGTVVDAKGMKGVVDIHLVEEGNEQFIDVAPDLDFVRSVDRAYPLAVDPVVIASPQSPTDSFVDEACQSCNYNGLTFLKAGRMGSAQYYSFVRFPDLTRILGKQVGYAELRVQASYEDDPLGKGLLALRTHGSWDASTITWANMPNHGDSQNYRINKTVQGGPDYYFIITSWAQGWAAGLDGQWINGKWSPYGATINTGGDNAFYQLGAAESTFVPEIPSMTVHYTNQSPNLPNNLSPADGWVGTSAPQLSATFSDPDDSNGWIEFDFNNAITAVVPTVNGTASWTPPAQTGTNSWRARGRDFDSAGPWTALRYFTINNKPSVDQLSPADGHYNTTLPALAARYLDPDNNVGTLRFEIDGVTYSVGGIVNGATGSCTTANLCLPSSMAPGLHSWRVQAVDAFGLASDWSPYQQFEYHYAGQVVREEFPVNGSQWDTTKWATSSGLSVSSNQGVFPAVTSSKRATATAAYLQDSEVTFTYSIPDRSAGTELRITMRGYGATGSAQLPNGYRLDIPSGSNTMTLKKVVSSTVSTLGSFTYSGPLNGSPVRVRFRVDGSKISVKVWAAGTLEPAAWSLERTDSTITAAGTLQIAQSYQSGSGRVIYVDNVTYQNRSYWGVDSVTEVTQANLNNVQSTYGGKPVFWGRYLHDEGSNNHFGLNRNDPNEVAFLSSSNIPVLVVDYNPSDDVLTTEAKGRQAADLAIKHAGPPSPSAPDALNIPKSVAIFANVEANIPIDKDWIWGWFDQLSRVGGWKVGYYANPLSTQNFEPAFCDAAELHPELLTGTYIWSSAPHHGRTREATAPTYRAEGINCDIYGSFDSLAWQYGLAGQPPNSNEAPGLPTPHFVDTDLIKPEMLDLLWYPGGVSCPAPRGASCI